MGLKNMLVEDIKQTEESNDIGQPKKPEKVAGIPIEQVLQRFQEFSLVPEDELERYKGICLTAKAYIEKRVRPEVSLDCGIDMGRLCAAAAACAYCEHLMIQGGVAPVSEEVRVGDISLRSARFGEDKSHSAQFREYFLVQAADLLEPEFIPFKKVGET